MSTSRIVLQLTPWRFAMALINPHRRRPLGARGAAASSWRSASTCASVSFARPCFSPRGVVLRRRSRAPGAAHALRTPSPTCCRATGSARRCVTSSACALRRSGDHNARCVALLRATRSGGTRRPRCAAPIRSRVSALGLMRPSPPSVLLVKLQPIDRSRAIHAASRAAHPSPTPRSTLCIVGNRPAARTARSHAPRWQRSPRRAS